MSEPARRNQPPVQDHVARQILVFTAETIGNPGAHRRTALEVQYRCVQEVIGIRVLRKIGHHGPNHCQIVGTTSDVRKKLTNRKTALAIAFEFPGALQNGAYIVELRGVNLELVVLNSSQRR